MYVIINHNILAQNNSTVLPEILSAHEHLLVLNFAANVEAYLMADLPLSRAFSRFVFQYLLCYNDSIFGSKTVHFRSQGWGTA